MQTQVAAVLVSPTAWSTIFSRTDVVDIAFQGGELYISTYGDMWPIGAGANMGPCLSENLNEGYVYKTSAASNFQTETR